MLNSGGEVYWSKKVRSIAAKRKARAKMFDGAAMKDIHRGVQQWQRQVLQPWTTKSGESKEDFQTASGIPLKPIYTPEDVEDQSYPDLSFPGVYPYTRGVYPSMYRGRLWTMRMFSGFGTPEDTNKRLKLLLKHGETGLSIAFDMPTLYGYDADHEKAHGEVGRCGVNVSSLRDMEVIFRGIPLDKVSTSMTINAPASVLTCMYAGVARKTGIPAECPEGDGPGGHAEGVHRAEGVGLPSGGAPAARPGHDGLLHQEHAAVELRQHQRLSHQGGRLERGPGAGVHARRRVRLRRARSRRRDSRSTTLRRG